MKDLAVRFTFRFKDGSYEDLEVQMENSFSEIINAAKDFAEDPYLLSHLLERVDVYIPKNGGFFRAFTNGKIRFCPCKTPDLEEE